MSTLGNGLVLPDVNRCESHSKVRYRRWYFMVVHGFLKLTISYWTATIKSFSYLISLSYTLTASWISVKLHKIIFAFYNNELRLWKIFDDCLGLLLLGLLYQQKRRSIHFGWQYSKKKNSFMMMLLQNCCITIRHYLQI